MADDRAGEWLEGTLLVGEAAASGRVAVVGPVDVVTLKSTSVVEVEPGGVTMDMGDGRIVSASDSLSEVWSMVSAHGELVETDIRVVV
ncbi:hypothetical protein LTR56_001939 [Elasticomyces elasticus]|nr:hypothetical protein LTR22_024795 [Elasticomyces elasticus]KAK3658083.1 hypothetical protein LTR56_001939 [Elasticomyces elasticus]KAK4923547.1 hypothetical protein LTR49_009260 [Elasticomyces elasticus]KAK5749775.1 hypothetical protein LTS12_020135 [Elasticomyces elasticus]